MEGGGGLLALVEVAEPGALGKWSFVDDGGEKVDAVDVFWGSCSGGLEGGWEDVDVADAVGEGCSSLEVAGGPTEGGCDTGAAFVEVEFCAAIRGVAAGAEDASVIAKEDDESVGGVGAGFDGFKNLADGAVQRRYHCGVGAPFFVFDGRVEGEVGFGGLVGRVGSVEGEVEEVGFFGWGIVDEIYGVFCEKVGGVAIFAESGVIVVPVELFFTFVSEVADGSVVMSHEVGEAVGEGEVGFLGVTEVPFSDDATTFVAGLCEKFGKGVFFGG